MAVFYVSHSDFHIISFINLKQTKYAAMIRYALVSLNRVLEDIPIYLFIYTMNSCSSDEIKCEKNL